MHSQNWENVLCADWLILLSVVSQKRLANLHFLGNITYFLGNITYFLGNTVDREIFSVKNFSPVA